ncbi:hypothetical protein ABTL66_19170, partial [Acinetobacter baumannii]
AGGAADHAAAADHTDRPDPGHPGGTAGIDPGHRSDRQSGRGAKLSLVDGKSLYQYCISGRDECLGIIRHA